MEKQELKTIVSWIINRKCKRDDNIHIKRAVKKSKMVTRLTKWDDEETIDMLTNDLVENNWKYLELLEKPFAYVSKLIYDVSLPKILDTFIQERIEKQDGGGCI